uniref:CD276 molecule n=1 Tax=Sinocyclocheilus rhinocerous TaxID=307959 RepID=A0A673HM02_9TELE
FEKLTLMTGFVVQALDVRVPESPAVALFGSDAVLNCSFLGVSEFNLSDLSVFWQLSDTKRAVHSFWQSRDQLSDQEERFSNRTSLFPDQLVSGNVSLLLRRVRVADEGSYSCFVRVQTYGSAAMLMQVHALRMSTRTNLLTARSSSRPLALKCLNWQSLNEFSLNTDINVCCSGLTCGLFSVKSVLTVILEPSSTYSCRLSQPLLGEEAQASVTITQGLVFPPLALWLTVALAVCLLALLVALAVVCRRKIRESCEEMRAGEEHILQRKSEHLADPLHS